VLKQAVSAVSLATFSHQVGAEKFLIKARKEYGKTLVLLLEAISGGQLTSDSTLAGVLCLNMYEVRVCTQIFAVWYLLIQMFSGDEPARSIWETHSDALSMILQARGTLSQFTLPVCGGICRGAHRVIVRVFLIYILKMMISNLRASCSRINSSEKRPAPKVRCERKV
jgi:hypothetical protein